MKKIESLTEAQKARFQEFIQKWTEIGLSTQPADRERAEAAIRLVYENGGKKLPLKIVWCGSPLSQGLTRAIIFDKKLMTNIGASVRDSVRASVWDSVLASVRDSVGASVGASVRASVWDSVLASVWDSVGDSVRASVWDSVLASVRDSVLASVRDSVRASVWDSVGDSVLASVRDSVGASVGASVLASGYGQHDAGWLAFYSFFNEVLDLKKETEKLEGLWELAKSAGWILPHENVCWVSERHDILKRDEIGRLHSLDGPALQYPDGWRIYAIHGVRVPAYVVESPGQITVTKIEDQNNSEIRRVMIDQYGQSKYLRDSNSVKVCQDDYGTLWRKDIPNDEPMVMVEVLNSTEEPDGTFKTYFLRVNPELRPLLDGGKMGEPQKATPLNGIASTFGMRGEEYVLEMQT